MSIRSERASAPARSIVGSVRVVFLFVVLFVFGGLFGASTLPVLAATPPAQTAVAAPAAQTEHTAGGEANLILPDLSTESFQGINGRTLLMSGLLVCVLGLGFGMTIFTRLKNMPVHP